MPFAGLAMSSDSWRNASSESNVADEDFREDAWRDNPDIVRDVENLKAIYGDFSVNVRYGERPREAAI
jgi:hypothetical protein